LIRESRLIAGVYTLSEVDEKMRQLCLLMEEKEGRQCTPDDAAVLAQYEGLVPTRKGMEILYGPPSNRFRKKGSVMT
jgi:hypothetical protein